MEPAESYNSWSSQYDANQNKTRDLEGVAIRTLLAKMPIDHVLEIGCGTGKNTEWLITRASQVLAIDLSESMLAVARDKIISPIVQFLQADVIKPWTFVDRQFDLVSFSLVLEHIANLEPIFSEAAHALKPGGYVYLGELHPFKQYLGTKARFTTSDGVQEVTCFNHHISDFINAAEINGLQLFDLQEFFDEDEKEIPRILCIIIRKPGECKMQNAK
jgi:ubiquinone/menaquinone biosynthesis C-methylase UbiE